VQNLCAKGFSDKKKIAFLTKIFYPSLFLFKRYGPSLQNGIMIEIKSIKKRVKRKKEKERKSIKHYTMRIDINGYSF
jgi:hypothetical protein